MTITENLIDLAGFIRSTAGDLPEPGDIQIQAGANGVSLLFDNPESVRQWAAYFGEAATEHRSESTGRTHHRAECNYLGRVTFYCLHIEKAPVVDMPRDCEVVVL